METPTPRMAPRSAIIYLADRLRGVGHGGLKKSARQGILKRTTPGKDSRVVLRKALVATISGLLLFVSSHTILAVKRPPYPTKAEQPDAGHWVIIGTDEKAR